MSVSLNTAAQVFITNPSIKRITVGAVRMSRKQVAHKLAKSSVIPNNLLNLFVENQTEGKAEIVRT